MSIQLKLWVGCRQCAAPLQLWERDAYRYCYCGESNYIADYRPLWALVRLGRLNDARQYFAEHVQKKFAERGQKKPLK